MRDHIVEAEKLLSETSHKTNEAASAMRLAQIVRQLAFLCQAQEKKHWWQR